jgi:hypothetical protein
MHNKKMDNMKKRNLYILLSGLLFFISPSCEDNVNNWATDKSRDRLFRPTSFESSTLEPTSVLVKYFGVMDATKYVFEFSEGDSLEFNNIVRTAEILADTVTPYSEASTIVETEYRTWFEDLKGTTAYSVRMKAVNETDNVESGYSQFYFKTPDEQIFEVTWPSLSKVTFTWEPGLAVTGIIYWETVSGQETATSYPLSDEEKADGQATITGLPSGIAYSAQILNNNAVRGRSTFTTLGLRAESGVTVAVSPGDNINLLLTDQTETGHPVVALAFAGNQIYELNEITIPEGVQAVYFIGDVGYGETIPELDLYRINMSAPFDLIRFLKVDVNANLNAKNYVFDISTANCFRNIEFEDCTIRNIGRSLVRPNASELLIDKITFNNCIINNVGSGGYGLVCMGKEDGGVNLISVTNSTITEIGSDRLMDLIAGVGQVTMDKVTLCNYTSKSKHIINFRSAPGRTSVTNCIFCGTNGNSEIGSLGAASQSGYVLFDMCYVTSDLKISETVPFDGAATLSMSSTEMFVDPQNGDFHLKDGVRYAGAGKAGDPRWW